MQELRLGAAGVLRAELDVVTQRLGEGDHLPRARHHLLFGHAQLVLAVQRAGRQKHVDTREFRDLDGVERGLDVLLRRARQAADDRRLAARATRDRLDADGLGDVVHRLKVVRRGRGKASLDHVHAQA